MTSGVSQGVSQKGKSRKLPPFLSFLKVEIPYKDGMEEVVGSNPICSIAQKLVNMRLLSFFFFPIAIRSG
jgi:hypothetical protein